jgi:hypothetical protein
MRSAVFCHVRFAMRSLRRDRSCRTTVEAFGKV